MKGNFHVPFCRRVEVGDNLLDSIGIAVQSAKCTHWLGHLFLPFQKVKDEWSNAQ